MSITEIYKRDKNLFISMAALCIFAAALPFSVTFIQGGILLFIAAALVRRHGQGTLYAIGAELKTNPLIIPWIIYMAAGILAAIFGVAPGHSFASLNSDLFRVVAFLAFCLFLEPQARDLLLNVYLTAVTAAGAWGVCQAMNGLLHGLDIRAHASDHPVRFGEIMVIGLSLALSRLIAEEGLSSRAKKLLVAATLILASAVALSQTRGAYIGMALVFVTAFLASRGQKRLVIYMLTGAAVLGLGLSMLNPTIRYKAGSIFRGANSAVTQTAAPDQSIGTRLVLWRTGFKIIKAHPLFGVGPANVKTVFPDYCPQPYPEGTIWGSLHNLYINQGAERGLVGLAALLTLFITMLVLAIRCYHAAPSHLTLWALVIMPSWFQMNFTEITFQHVHTSYAIFLALAVAIKAREAAIPR